MATYVNDLRLKEIATGDEAGTWGTSTNTNLQLIGEALGYGTQDCFASDADSTTTVADGASDPARAMYFKVTSSATLTATRTLTIAPNTVSRVMIIENATTGSQSIAISQGSGGNVTIASGQTKMVYLDGAGSGGAVVDALADLELGTITVADLTATTADINGGTIDGVTIGGASAGAGTFTTLNATGGGALTGTWSDLGTVTTVDINGGTIDGVTIGGASAGAITGTTGQFNTSLNVDGTVTADDSVVIEGTSPKIFLNETDTTDVNTRIRNAFGSLQIQSVDDSDGSPVTRLGIDHSTGDISFYDSAGSSQSFFWDASAESLQLGSTTSDESSLFAYKNSATYPAITVRQDGSAPIQRWLGASGAELMRITSAGSVGIGTSSPATQLAVALPSGTNGDIISMARSGGAYNFNLGLDANSTWYVANASDEKILNVAYTGNVGIGTSSPNVLGHFYKGSSGRTWTPDGADVLAIENNDSIVLDIRTPNSNQGLILFSDSDARGRGIVGYAHSSDHMYFNTAGSERMRLDASGNVGIGTTSPGVALDINRPTSTPSYARVGNGGNVQAYIGVAGDNLPVLGSYTNHALRFAVNTSEIARFDTGGNLLVGTTSTSNGSHTFANSSGTRTAFNNPDANAYGVIISYQTADPNSTSNEFLYCQSYSGGGVLRAAIRSNGGLANYQANDVNLSDERVKTDIAPLGSMWDKFKALEIVTFKYKDQTHDDDNIGVIAQQVEAVAPEFVDNDGFGETPEGEEPLKAIYTADLYHAAIKALQEAMARIETLEAEVAALKGA